MSQVDEDIWAEAWLERNYTGAPDECSDCYRNGKLVKITDCLKHDRGHIDTALRKIVPSLV